MSVVSVDKRMADARTTARYIFGCPDDELDQKVNALAKMRISGDGPPFHKVGRRVLYDLNKVDGWLDAEERPSTSAAH